MIERKLAKILIIEDDPGMCRMYGAVLRIANPDYKVTQAHSGNDAIKLALEKRPDLVILDLTLPDISGIAVAQKLWELGVLPGAPLIIASGLGDDGQAAALSLGAAAYLGKPFNPSDMVAAVDKALAGAIG